MDPQPVISWFRVGTFVSTVGAGVMLLDSATPEVKSVAVIALLVVNAALTVFFPTTSAQSPVVRALRKLTK